MSVSFDWLWRSPQVLDGIGSRRASELAGRSIEDVWDLLNYLPRAYRDFREITPLAEAPQGVETAYRVRVVRAPVRPRGRRFWRAVVEDDSGTADLFWFTPRLPGPAVDLAPGDNIVIVGKPDRKRLTPTFSHPRIYGEGQRIDIEPVYRGVPWLTQTMPRAVAGAAPTLAAIDPLPEVQRRVWDVPRWDEAFAEIHAPRPDADVVTLQRQNGAGYRRVAVDALFCWFLGLALRRYWQRQEQAVPVTVASAVRAELEGALPFALTGDQRAALDAIVADLAGSTPMYRLVQGDVGSGKTAVALIAAALVARAGGQVALLAPTEILAAQHVRFFDAVLGASGIRIARLSGSLSAVRRKELQFMIEKGGVDIVIGTHALLSDDLAFRDLRLVVIDEEQRYGVAQRSALRSKGGTPHTLLLTATPIPRSLALTLLGETDVTTIREKPAGRAEVDTRLVPPEGKRVVLEHIKTELEQGHKVFFLYPRVEDEGDADRRSVEQMHQRLSDYFGAERVGLLHGRMKGEEKDRVLRALVDGRISILVATTVIEVGVDVPDATVLVIGGADAFGLSQLHQIRGRIGRGRLPGTCYVLLEDHFADETRKRLEAFAATTDGFEIAEADLELRGPGSVLGMRQSGMPDIHPVLLRRFRDLVPDLRSAAFAIVDEDPQLLDPRWRGYRELLLRKWDIRPDRG
ncbi:MAG: ATP-dependent DNA helicase RecG [Candidatus Dadabacteria bacterium]|nr:MAG: ATP-dependent DNA helicase RecG [Candidatus Dadabacteria bacterium]